MSKAAMLKAKDTMIDLWNKMSTSHMEDAGDDADMFERSFYELMDEVKSWLHSLENPPATMEEALAVKEIDEIYSELPSPLIINFETELEEIIEEVIKGRS